MRLLLANDDGIDAKGMAALERAVEGLAEVWVVAPMKEHSAQSHALTLHKPLRAIPRGERRFACSGTPADCVYLGLHGLLPERPDLVVSGVNRGSNLGYDTWYSGTVAAAREAALSGVPSVALSLHPGVSAGTGPFRWDTAEHAARELVRDLLASPPDPGTYLNVNIPNRAVAELRGRRVVRLGSRVYESRVEQRHDPRGRPYYWLGGEHGAFDADAETDGQVCEAGWISITPLQADPTHHAALGRLGALLDR
ncbi:MAG TPA: 5'/3'-nucleotidase SurE [Myxococcota bacterium]|nr:5'/3'-nucleotidase SurE [Myxococcota bacterium]